MDSLTQGVLGAAIGDALLGKKIGTKGALLGVLIATVPDLDVILYLFYNKLDMLSIHRGFSHSILFSILGTFLIAYSLSKWRWTKSLSYPRIWVFTWLCLFTHMLLDTFTAYGTQLLLPFSNQRLGTDSINVVDPLYTVPLMMGLVFSLWIFKSRPNRSKYNKYGLAVSTFYLLFTLINKEGVKREISSRLSDENIEYQSLMTMPVGIANLSWYGVAKGADSIYMLRHSIISFESDPIEAFAIHDEYLDEIDPLIAEKMRWFAKGNYTVDKVKDKIRIYNLQVDMRGIVNTDDLRAPTMGYFEITNINDIQTFSSGSIKL